eukprot:7478935-Alexandrium_andersonii.AAC.1
MAVDNRPKAPPVTIEVSVSILQRGERLPELDARKGVQLVICRAYTSVVRRRGGVSRNSGQQRRALRL